MKEYVDIRDSVALGAHKIKSADIYLKDGREYSADFARQKTGYGEKCSLSVRYVEQ